MEAMRAVPRTRRGNEARARRIGHLTGHLGIAKTITRAAREFYWPGMFRDIARYVWNCENCQAYKVEQTEPLGTMHATAVNRPWQQVTMDLVGPLPRSNRGYTWLLNMQD